MIFYHDMITVMTTIRKHGRRITKNKKRKNLKNTKNMKSKKRGKRDVIRHEGGIVHFSKKIYEFIDANPELFVLDNLTEDHSLNMNCLNKYIDFQTESNEKSKPFWNFYQYLYNNVLYISNQNIQDQYEKNAHELYGLSQSKTVDGKKYYLVLILPEEKTKSDFYFTLYFLHLYKNLYPNDYVNITIIIESEIKKGITRPHPDSQHIIYIITDDFCYSGEQMSNTIKYQYKKQFLRYIDGKRRDYSIYINVFGMTDIALKNINTITWVTIRIPDKCTTVENINYLAIFNKYCKEHNYDIKPESVDMFYFTEDDVKLKSFTKRLIEYKDLPLIYLPYKYPDMISFPTRLCYFMEMSNTYFIANGDYIGENTIKYENNILDKYNDEEMLRKEISQMDFIFQLNSMELFKEKYPELVHTVNTNEFGIVHMLKLINNCNYASIDFTNKKIPNCNHFCYKPFYKKKKYLDKISVL